MNGTIPATVKSSEGSSLIREADGTTVCCLLAKKSSQRRLISAVFIVYLADFGAEVRFAAGFAAGLSSSE
jgi:hypothetical protein